jgi:hypothetical protein
VELNKIRKFIPSLNLTLERLKQINTPLHSMLNANEYCRERKSRLGDGRGNLSIRSSVARETSFWTCIWQRCRGDSREASLLSSWGTCSGHLRITELPCLEWHEQRWVKRSLIYQWVLGGGRGKENDREWIILKHCICVWRKYNAIHCKLWTSGE